MQILGTLSEAKFAVDLFVCTLNKKLIIFGMVVVQLHWLCGGPALKNVLHISGYLAYKLINERIISKNVIGQKTSLFYSGELVISFLASDFETFSFCSTTFLF